MYSLLDGSGNTSKACQQCTQQLQATLRSAQFEQEGRSLTSVARQSTGLWVPLRGGILWLRLRNEVGLTMLSTAKTQLVLS